MHTDPIKCFLDEVCKRIRWRRCRAAVRAELAAHIEDRVDYLISQRGFTEEEAIVLALGSMGDPAALGHTLDLLHRPWRAAICLGISLLLWTAIIAIALWLIYIILAK